MLISLDWIKEFTNVPEELSPSELGVRLTMATCEVEDVQTTGEFWKRIKVAEITKIDPHPEADKLNLVTFNFGKDETARVVCGASNVRVGLRTPYAPIGTTLPIGFTLEPKKIRGILSEGMLCSEEELGLKDESSGIMELPADAPVGKTLLEYFEETTDTLFDIDNKSLTHRPDLWGHYGMAREFAAIFKNEFKNPYDDKWANNLKKNFTKDKSPVKVKVDNDSAGLAYYGLTIEGVVVGESPRWMQNRLNAVGLRPINSIVDISNYVMLELGIPNHIFDRNSIKGDTVHIKRLGKEETFVTLDEIERPLVPFDTVISDCEKPLVIGGIMGGLNSGVTSETTTVFLEVANWKASEIRRTSTRLGLRTDSSQRYEKTLDSQLCERTMLRLLELILELNPGAKVVGGLEYDGDDLTKTTALTIDLGVDHIVKVLGKQLTENEIVEILERLDFSVKSKGGQLSVTVPSYRATKDIECDADVIEEIGRIIGYDNIESTSPKLEITPARLTPAQSLCRKIRDFLVFDSRCFEIMTYPLVGEKLLKKAMWPGTCEELRLVNSLSKDHDRMRDSLIPSLLQAAAENNKNFSEFRFFEYGRSYLTDKKEFSRDHYQVAMVFADREQNVFMDTVDTTKRLLQATNIPADLTERHPKFKNEIVNEEWVGAHPYEFYNIRIMGKMKGVIFSIHPLVLRTFKIKGHLSMAIIDITDFHERPLKDKVKYEPLPKFPSSQFDYTVSLDHQTPVGDVLTTLNKIKLKEARYHRVLDIFFSDDKKHVTLRTEFYDPERTLSGDFLKEAEKTIISKLAESGFHLKQA